MWAAAAVAGVTARAAAVALVREAGEPMHFSAIGYELGKPPGPWVVYGDGYARWAPGWAYFTAEGILAGVRAAVEAGELVEVMPQVFGLPGVPA